MHFLLFIIIIGQKMEYYKGTFTISDIQVNSNSGQKSSNQLKDLQETNENLVSQTQFILQNTTRILWFIYFIFKTIIFIPPTLASTCSSLAPHLRSVYLLFHGIGRVGMRRSEEHTSELQSQR